MSAVQTNRIPLELQDLFTKREFAEKYGFKPKEVDNLSMHYVNGFREIDIAKATKREQENDRTNNQSQAYTRH